MSEQESHGATQANKIISLCWCAGSLAASYYDIDQLELYAIQQAVEPRPQYPLVRNLIRQYSPLFHLVSGSKIFLDDVPELLELPEGTMLQHVSSGKIESFERGRICHFDSKSIKASAAKILAMNLPGMPAQASESERRIFMESVLPFDQELLIHSVGSLLKLLDQVIPDSDGPMVTRINVRTPESQLIIDELTYQALQIFNSRLHPSGFKRNLETGACSLFKLLNTCSSKIGKLELRTIMQQPIRDTVELNQRFTTVQWLADQRNVRATKEMRSLISNLTKVQLLYKKIATKSARNNDWKSFKKNIYYIYLLCKLCLSVTDPAVKGTPIEDLSKFVAEQNNALKQLLFTLDEVVDLERGEQNNRFAVKNGIDRELDRMQLSYDETRMALLETSRLDIENLPIDVEDIYVTFLPSYGFVFSTNMNEELRNTSIFEQSSMNLLFQSDSTLYFQNNLCRDLNVEFSNLMAAKSDREQEILEKLVVFVERVIPQVLEAFKMSSKLDAMLAFASLAESQGYTRPVVTNEKILQIKQGRHPLLEQFKTYRPNDTDVNLGGEGLVQIFAAQESNGKTIYLKEVALICYLAHIGSFVPAQAATVGLLDSIYTRLDYPESIFSGKSSFMGELFQMSAILLNTTSRSLVLIDEFGKGTTYSEGKSLLISSVEHLLQKDHQVPITLVATQFSSIANYLSDNRHLQIYTTHSNEGKESNESSRPNSESIEHCQELLTTFTQTMTLTLIKKFLTNEIINPALVVQLYNSVPITQALSR